MFISSYTAIYLFVKKFNLNIYTSLYVFDWERGHQLSTYATDGGIGGLIQNACSCAISFSCFWQHFCLIVYCQKRFLITRGFELATCGFELVTHNVELVTRKFKVWTRTFHLNSQFWISTRAFKLSTRN